MSAPAKRPTLYGHWRSSCSWRVRIALADKGVDHAYQPVSLLRDCGEQRRDGALVAVTDVFLVPQIYNAGRHGVDLAPLSTLTRIEAACMALPAFQAAHADRQADAVAAGA